MLKFRSKMAAVGMLAVAMSMVMAGLAMGASNHGISGTVYSGCSGNGPWYISSTQRMKSGSGAVKASFSQINDGGLTFGILDQSWAQIGVQQSWTKSETGIWRTFSSSVPDGKIFYNEFRDTNYNCPDSQNNYNFTGTEYY
ncbi:MAG TPA: hypothetical protein VK464_20030 [Symbiobacteriaceae bacterium]|nr:hypothetical protein [Symbiobacteriaceae bacterium]